MLDFRISSVVCVNIKISVSVKVHGFSDIVDLIGKTWRIYKMSPLFGFKYGAQQLKQYSRHLAAHIVSVSRTNSLLLLQFTRYILLYKCLI